MPAFAFRSGNDRKSFGLADIRLTEKFSQMATDLLRAEQLCLAQPGQVTGDIALKPGARLGILGAAASGKTQLLRVLARLVPTQGGRLFWGDTEVTQRPRWLLRKMRTFTTLLLANPYTALEPWAPVGKFIDGPADSQVDMTAHLHAGSLPEIVAGAQVDALSGMSRVRLALTCALSRGSRVVLVDDVFCTLLPEVWSKLYSEMDRALGESRALLVASRAWTALQGVDDIFVLWRGRFVEWGPRAAVFAQPQHPYTRWLLQNASCKSRKFKDADYINAPLRAPEEVAPAHWARHWGSM